MAGRSRRENLKVQALRSGTALAYIAAMTLAPKIGLSLGGLGLVAFGGVLWAKFGSLVWFDTLAAAFMGCFV